MEAYAVLALLPVLLIDITESIQDLSWSNLERSCDDNSKIEFCKHLFYCTAGFRFQNISLKWRKIAVAQSSLNCNILLNRARVGTSEYKYFPVWDYNLSIIYYYLSLKKKKTQQKNDDVRVISFIVFTGNLDFLFLYNIWFFSTILTLKNFKSIEIFIQTFTYIYILTRFLKLSLFKLHCKKDLPFKCFSIYNFSIHEVNWSDWY